MVSRGSRARLLANRQVWQINAAAEQRSLADEVLERSRVLSKSDVFAIDNIENVEGRRAVESDLLRESFLGGQRACDKRNCVGHKVRAHKIIELWRVIVIERPLADDNQKGVCEARFHADMRVKLRDSACDIIARRREFRKFVSALQVLCWRDNLRGQLNAFAVEIKSATDDNRSRYQTFLGRNRLECQQQSDNKDDCKPFFSYQSQRLFPLCRGVGDVVCCILQ